MMPIINTQAIKCKSKQGDWMNFTLPAVALGAFISICLHFFLAPIIG